MSRLVPMMATFPSLTPADIWGMAHREWLLLAYATQVRQDEMEKANRR